MMNNNDANNTSRQCVSKSPIFLAKIYDMVETADENLICWSDDGLHFAIKDHERFAAEIIPQYFTHNNFSSLVRQLNFHGFRKIKLDPLRISPEQVQLESRYWRYMHKNFRRGRPDLLCFVKGKHQLQQQCDGVDPQEYESVKEEIHSLRKEVTELTKDLKSLSKMVFKIVQEEKTCMEIAAHSNNIPQAPTASFDSITPMKRGSATLFDVTCSPISDNKRYACGSPRINTGPDRSIQSRSMELPEQRSTFPNIGQGKQHATVPRSRVRQGRIPFFSKGSREKRSGENGRRDDVRLPAPSTDSQVLDDTRRAERRDSESSFDSIATIDTELIIRDEEWLKM